MNKPNSPVSTSSALKKDLVSVIVPCYNQAEFLEECLSSLLRQSYTVWECIILDDGSTDGSSEIAMLFCQKDDRFRYVHQANQGLVAARNNGILNSSGEFILPLDGDDKIGPDYLLQALTVFRKLPETQIVYCQARFFGAVDKPWDLPSFSMKNILKENIIFCSAFFRREEFLRTKGYNKNMASGLEDWDFWLSLIEKESAVVQLPDVQFYYRIRNNSMSAVIEKEKYVEMLRQLYQNHKKLFDFYQVDPVLCWERRRRGSFWDRLKRTLYPYLKRNKIVEAGTKKKL